MTGAKTVGLVAGASFFSGLAGYLMGGKEAKTNTVTEMRTVTNYVTMTERNTVTEKSVTTQKTTTTVTRYVTSESGGLNHRLIPGISLNVKVNADRVIGNVNRKALGVSFFLVGDGDAGWMVEGKCRAGLPVDRYGNYRLNNHSCGDFEEAVRGLKLQTTRVYDVAMYDRWKHAGKADDNWYMQFDAKRALDIWSGLADRLSIPQENIVLGIQLYTSQHDRDTIFPRPEFWAELVKYSVSQGYGFRMWEIGNEVYLAWVERDTGFVLNGFSDNRDSIDVQVARFSAYFKDVSNAIKAVQPEAQTGLSINGVDDFTLPGTWTQRVLEATAGYYDFLVGHYYNWGDGLVSDDGLENFSLAFNYAVMRVQASQLEMARQIPRNHGKRVYHFDTEWGAAGTRKRGDWNVYSEPRNGNTYGVLQNAVRLVYYLREGLVDGACRWAMFARNPLEEPAFGLLTHEKPELRSMVYWLYYYFQRFLGGIILDVSGTAPYYYSVVSRHHWHGISIPGDGPITPILASKSSDGNQVFLIIVNASEKNSYELRIELANFKCNKITGYVLRDNRVLESAESWKNNNPFSTREDDFIQPYRDIAVMDGGTLLKGMTPSRAVLFIMLTS